MWTIISLVDKNKHEFLEWLALSYGFSETLIKTFSNSSNYWTYFLFISFNSLFKFYLHFLKTYFLKFLHYQHYHDIFWSIQLSFLSLLWNFIMIFFYELLSAFTYHLCLSKDHNIYPTNKSNIVQTTYDINLYILKNESIVIDL